MFQLIKENKQLTKLVKKTIKSFEKTGVPAKLIDKDYHFIAEFDHLILLLECLLSKINEITDIEEEALINLLEHALFQYKIDIENGIKNERDFSLMQCIEARIERQVSIVDAKGFISLRNVISTLFKLGFNVNEGLINHINEVEYGNDSDDMQQQSYELSDLSAQFIEMIEATGANSDYDVYMQVANQLNQMPAEAVGLMMLTLLQTDHPLAKQSAILLLLHPLAPVRLHAVGVINELAQQDFLNAKDYQRLTVIRHWMDDAQKVEIDKTIKLLQRSELSPVADNKSKPLELYKIYVSSIDNSGCIGLQVVFKASRKYLMLGCVLKQGMGIKDAFISDKMSLSQHQSIIEEMNETVPLVAISEEQLEILLKHFLQVTLVSGNTPPAEILILNEYLKKQWHYPLLLSIDQVKEILGHNYLEQNKLCQEIMLLEEFVFGWASPEYQKNHENEDELIEAEFEPHRELWLERLLLTLITFSFDREEEALLFNAAKKIDQGKKLTSIELFQKIAFVVLNVDLFVPGDEDVEEMLLQKILDDNGELPPELLALLEGEEPDDELFDQFLGDSFDNETLKWQSKKSKAKRAVYQLKISLKRSKPAVWRRVEVMNTIKLSALHEIIQVAMGWENCHLHEFEHGRDRFSEPSENSDSNFYDTADVQLRELLYKEKAKLNYSYDFGDGWEHLIVLEKIIKADRKNTPTRVTKGGGACPLEDSGGLGGYARLLKIIKDPKHAEYDEYREWFELEDGDDFDPAFYDIDEVNAIFDEYFN